MTTKTVSPVFLFTSFSKTLDKWISCIISILYPATEIDINNLSISNMSLLFKKKKKNTSFATYFFHKTEILNYVSQDHMTPCMKNSILTVKSCD